MKAAMIGALGSGMVAALLVIGLIAVLRLRR
jgi:hypothetical protein